MHKIVTGLLVTLTHGPTHLTGSSEMALICLILSCLKCCQEFPTKAFVFFSKVFATPWSGGISGTHTSLDNHDIQIFLDKVRISDSVRLIFAFMCLQCISPCRKQVNKHKS